MLYYIKWFRSMKQNKNQKPKNSEHRIVMDKLDPIFEY